MIDAPTIVVETGSGLDPSALISGALGVAGGLAVYFLGQRSAKKREREETSERSAGELLTALFRFSAAWRDKPVLGGRSRMVMPTSDDEWLELELASAIHVPRVTSKTVRFAMQKMLAVHHEYASRKYSDDVEKEDVEADSKAKRERFTLALHDARDALQAYLREAALR